MKGTEKSVWNWLYFMPLSEQRNFDMEFISRSQYAIRSKEKSDPTRGIKGGVNTAKIFDRSFKQYESENKGMARLELCSAISTVVMEEVGGSDGNEVKVQKRIDRKNRRIRKKG